jgi:hypothetical protein
MTLEIILATVLALSIFGLTKEYSKKNTLVKELGEVNYTIYR